MLGWMLKRGDNAPGAVDGGDTTIIDAPDTPAPVFAARAFKSALFGVAPRPEEPRLTEKAKQASVSDLGSTTPPPKPTGILLTPGTGTSRPKRVSFGRDVKQSKSSEELASKANFIPRRTRLNEALEQARRVKISGVNKKVHSSKKQELSDDEWEEDFDEDDNYPNPDMTLDLNEPHSQSGKFWKEEFEKYHQDAKAEMEKMLKYKQLAKSYAQHKDNEAMELAELLKEEQQKVVAMEKKIAQHASELLAKGHTKPDQASPETLEKLTKQTTLAAQYKRRVEELEDQLEDFLEDKEEEMEALGTRRKSPRAQMTLVETQRELRRAKSQARENGALREQVASLQSRLRAAEQRAVKAESRAYEEQEDIPAADELKEELQDAKSELKSKDEQIEQLKKELESFRQESQAHDADTKAVLERAHTKIAELKKEVKSLKAGEREKAPVLRPKSWHASAGVNGNDEDDHDGRHKHAVNAAPNRATQISAARSRLEARRLARRSAPEVGTNHLENEIELPHRSPTLRDKFKENAPMIPDTMSDMGGPYASGALRERPNFEKPRWQPFVPRSPRNRAYLGDDVARQIENGGVTPTPAKQKNVPVSELPAIKALDRPDRRHSVYDTESQADLLRDRFANLDGPINSSMVGNTSKSTLPADRRAAALARIEERMAEKKRARGKENLKP